MKFLTVLKSILFTCFLKLKYRGYFEIGFPSFISNSSRIILKKQGHIKIGNRFHARENTNFTCAGGEINIGNQCFFNYNTIIASQKKITIGNNCSFGPNVCVYDHDHKFGREGYEANKYKYSEVNIGDNCWIGAGAIILRGTQIGGNSIIGAGTVVSGRIPSNSIISSERKVTIKALNK